MSNFTYQFQIGKCDIKLQVPVLLDIDEKFKPFLTRERGGISIKFVETEQITPIESVDFVTEEDVQFSEYLIDEKYVRTFHGTGTKIPYAILEQIDEKQWTCSYLKDAINHFRTLEGCVHHIAMERLLMEYKTMILHASLINFNGQGIIFTGVSGIGKTTQAHLWEKYEHAEILNGDRTVLYKENNIWYASGSPYAGSSNIHINETVPICAIVALGQDYINTCVKLKPIMAFRKLYEGITNNTWNESFMNNVLDLLTDLCTSIPFYYLRCRPEQFAVECLKTALLENDNQEVME